MQQKKSYLTKMADQLNKIDKDLNSLRGKIDQMSSQTRKEFESVLSDLKNRRNTIENKIKTSQAAGSDAWDKLKTGLDSSFNEFIKAFSEATNRLKKP